MTIRSAVNPATSILFFGVDTTGFQCHRKIVKGGLRAEDARWSVDSGMATDIEDAVYYIQHHDELELVLICNELAGKRTRQQIVHDCEILGRRLAEHPYNPWVMFGKEKFSYLEPIFRPFGIRVECGMPERIIRERWKSQIPDDSAAA
ncbi:hypothetical protein C4585_00520 [Candidatus Parcubacteria bacterium]|nr:MAG: hypothetical protein C4585_00520 [Candidatus Parcubacteria bacterium]